MRPNPEIFPKPISFYQHKHFTGQRHVPVDMGYDLSRITLLGVDEREKQRILSQLECQRFSYVGKLSGEYAIMRWALLAIDKNGTPIRINSVPDEDWLHDSWFHQLEMYCASDEFMRDRDAALASWNTLQCAQGAVVLSEVHAIRNYYHFTTGFLPKIRRSENVAQSVLCMPRDYVLRPFQVNLLMRTCGHRVISLYENTVRVNDPMFVQEPLCREAADWLRQTTGLKASRGARKIYVTRKSTIVGREHGSIHETDAFKGVLAEFGFEAIDFGEGDVPVEEQVRRLDGAGIILSAHGANLTNTIYVTGGASVIELLPYYWAQPGYMQIAALSDVRYFGLVCGVDPQSRLIVEPDALRSAIRSALQ